MDNTCAEFGKTFECDFFKCAVFDDEFAGSVDGCFGTNQTADAVANMDISVDGVTAARGEVNGFCTVVDRLLNGLGIVATRSGGCAVIALNADPLVCILFHRNQGFGDGKLKGILRRMTKVGRNIGRVFNDFRAFEAFTACRAAFFNRLGVAACSNVSGKEIPFVVNRRNIRLLFAVVF